MSATPGTDSDNFEQRDPEDLQREADAIRADMDRTLDALERKLSPKQLLDRSLTYMQANGGDILQKIGAAVNKNPLPLLVTSAGLIWLAASSRKSSSRSRFGSSSSLRRGDFDPSTQSFQGSDMSSYGMGEGSTSADSSRVKRATNQLRQRASRTYDATRQRTYEVGRNMNGLIQEQPLVCGAVALAVGAVIGASIPASRFERDLVARARESAGPLIDEMSQSLQGGGAQTSGQSSGQSSGMSSGSQGTGQTSSASAGAEGSQSLNASQPLNQTSRH
jgi:ElaB/YqjD/DUF883 family membrane-anchored ribosome-binding protein